jgi:outer membrane protein
MLFDAPQHGSLRAALKFLSRNPPRQAGMKIMKTTMFERAALVLTVAASVMALPCAAQAQDSGAWLVRVRAVDLKSANKDHTDLGADLSINDKWIPEFDISYFFTPNIAAELVLTYPQKQTLYSNGTSIGSFKHLPPTLTAQYHFTGLPGFRPYVGAGVNYTNISSVDVLGGAVGLKHNSFGLAAQIGVDVPVGGGWLVNLDLKKVQIKTDVYVGGVNHGSLKLDPLLVGIGVGKRF